MTLFVLVTIFCVLVFMVLCYLYDVREREERKRIEEELTRKKEEEWKKTLEEHQKELEKIEEQKRKRIEAERKMKEEEWKKKLEEQQKELEKGNSLRTLKERLFGCISMLFQSGHKQTTILLSGKTGVGKSSLINALLGETKAAEGHTLDPETSEVNEYHYTLRGMKVTLFDTPGLADGCGKEEEYLRKIKEKVTGPCDVFIFCTEMNTTRFRQDDTQTIQKLTETFSPQLWEHALVALTFANKVHAKKDADVTEIEYFNKRMLDFRKKITDDILKAGVPEQIVTKVPFVATGHLCEPSLPGIIDWTTNFWTETFLTLKMSAKLPFFLFNSGRIKPRSSSSSPTQKVREKQQGAPFIHLDEDTAGMVVKLVQASTGAYGQGIFQCILQFGIPFVLNLIMEAIKKIWPQESSEEDAKDKDEVA